jgi:plasmid stability protein
MSETITLPSDIVTMLRQAASTEERSTEELAIEVLRAALIDDAVPTPEEVVARIRALPHNPANIREAQGSLADVLDDGESRDFDLASWQADWARVEAEMAAIELADEQSDKQRN